MRVGAKDFIHINFTNSHLTAFSAPAFRAWLPSVRSKYSTKASIVQTLIPHSLPNLKQLSPLLISASNTSIPLCLASTPGSNNSQSTPAGALPASPQNSTVASVCPLQSLTPPLAGLPHDLRSIRSITPTDSPAPFIDLRILFTSGPISRNLQGYKDPEHKDHALKCSRVHRLEIGG